jgi:putative sporulation protein YtaF
MDLVNLWPILMLAIAISVDGFSVGITYGLKSIKLGIVPLLIISGISTIAIYLTSILGIGISDLLSGSNGNYLGGFLLVGLGLWLVFSAYLELNGQKNKSKDITFSLKLKSLKIMIKILKEPAQADFDRSGNINLLEALILGLALALDAMAVGLGTGLIGYSGIVMPAIIGIATFIFISCGYYIGDKVGDILPSHFEIYPGLIIVILGILKFI